MQRTIKLSPKQAEVLRLICFGYQHKHIADKLSISTKTVERHSEHIRKKAQIEAKNIAALIKRALMNNILTFEEWFTHKTEV